MAEKFNLPKSGFLVRFAEPKGRHFVQAQKLMAGNQEKYFPALFHLTVDVAVREGVEVTAPENAPAHVDSKPVTWEARPMEWFEDLPFADFTELVMRLGN